MCENLITRIEDTLNQAAVQGVSGFITKLRNNARSPEDFRDLVCEADGALLLQRGGFQVTMRDGPDLLLELEQLHLYAEVKHFRRKEQDRLDDERTRDSDDLVCVGNTMTLEGVEAWRQIVQVAESKSKRYAVDAPLILLIVSSSDFCIGPGEVLTAADKIGEIGARDHSSTLRKLGALLLIDLYNLLVDPHDGGNVYLFPLSSASMPLPSQARELLGVIKEY